jgi:GNAT superfamily N-acetyltransferase
MLHHVHALLLVASAIAALLLAILSISNLLLFFRGSGGPRGWLADDNELDCFTAQVGKEAMSISFRRMRWDERFTVADLVARAHRFTAAYVHLFEKTAPADLSDIRYMYTTEARDGLLRKNATRNVADSADAPSVAERVEGIHWILSRNFTMLHSNKNALAGVNTATGEIVCFAMLIDPKIDTYSLMDKVGVGLLNAPFDLGWSAFCRILTMPEELDSHEAAVIKLFGDSPQYLRLERVAVEPKLQGCGIGKGLMTAVNKVLDAQGAACYLSTQNERTAVMYERYGWETVTVDSCCSGTPFPFTSWSMWRGPQGKKKTR